MLDGAALGHDDDPVAVHERREAVGDGEGARLAQPRAQRRLDERVRLQVDRGGRLVEDEHLKKRVGKRASGGRRRARAGDGGWGHRWRRGAQIQGGCRPDTGARVRRKR